MKKNYFLSWAALCCFALLPFSLDAQTVFDDFSGTNCYGGFGTNTSAAAATSDVLEICKDAGAEVWGGAAGLETSDFSAGQTQVCFDVFLSAPGDVLLKYELSTTGSPDWEQAQTYTGPGYENICWDLTLPDAAGTGAIASGNIFGKTVIFPGFGQQVDICGQFMGAEIDPSIFGADDFGGAFTAPSYGDALEICKGAGSESWAGADWANGAANCGASQNVDLTDPTITQICIDVQMPAPGPFLLKLEPGTWEQQQSYSGNGEWQNLCFDLTQPDATGTGVVAAGGVFTNVVLFPDFNIGDTQACYRVDNIVGSELPPAPNVCTGTAAISNPGFLNDFDAGNCFDGGFGGASTGTVTSAATIGPLEMCKTAGSEVWAGAAYDVTVDFTNSTQYCLDVLMPVNGEFLIKFELASVPDWEQPLNYTGAGTWQTLCADLTLPGNVNGGPAAGEIFGKVVYFPNNGVGFVDECYQVYDSNVDDMGGFGEFGGLPLSLTCNTHLEICKPATGAETWAGASCTSQTIDVTESEEICIDVNLPGPGDVLYKLEGGGNPTWEQAQPYTGPGWETVCYDLTQPDAAGNGSVASGNSYTVHVIFPDFGEANTDECYLFDNIIVNPIECPDDPAVDCLITDITMGAQSACDPATNTYTQEVVLTFVNAPFLTSFDVNGQTFAVTTSPQTVMLTGLSSNGQSVSVTASNSSDPLCCMLTVADAFTAPATCFDFGVGPCDDVPFVATDFSGSFFGFGGGGSGAGWALNNGTVQLTTTSDVDFVGFVVQLVIPGGLTSYNDVVLAADVISNVAGGVEYRIESWSPGFGFETGRTDLLPAVAAGATSVSGSVLGGGADLTSEYYQIVFAATGGLMPGSGPLNISVDNISFTGFQTRVSRIVAGNHLFIENQPASPNMDCVYEWYSTDTGALVGTTTTPMFDPGAAGSYEVIVNCTDGSYTPCGPLVIDEIIDCSNCNE